MAKLDSIRFVVSNGSAESPEAEVLITLQPSSTDTAAPTVTSTYPAAPEGIQVVLDPVATDAYPPIYFRNLLGARRSRSGDLGQLYGMWGVAGTVSYDGILEVSGSDLRSVLFANHGLRPSKTYRFSIPKEKKLVLPKSGRDLIFVYQESGRKVFHGDYCLTLESSKKAWKSLKAVKLALDFRNSLP